MYLNERLVALLSALALMLVLSTSAHGQQRTAPAPPDEPLPTTAQAVEAQFDQMDRNRDGVLTRDEINPELRLYREFDRFDTNNTGTISLQEFREYVRVAREEQQRRQ